MIATFITLKCIQKVGACLLLRGMGENLPYILYFLMIILEKKKRERKREEIVESDGCHRFTCISIFHHGV